MKLLREVEQLKTPLHSFMQVVSDQAVALGLVKFPYLMGQLVLLSPGFSWQIIWENKMFLELQTQINYKRTLSDIASEGDEPDDLGLTFDLTTSLRFGSLVNDIAKIWGSIKTSEMSISFGAGGIAGNDVDYTDSVETLLTTPVYVESGKRGKLSSRVGSDGTDAKDTLLTEPSDASVTKERELDVPEGIRDATEGVAGRTKRTQQQKHRNSKRVSPVASAVTDFVDVAAESVKEEAVPVVAETHFPDLGSQAGKAGDEAPQADETTGEAPQADETADEAPQADEAVDETPQVDETADIAPSADETADEPALELDDEMPEALLLVLEQGQKKKNTEKEETWFG
jgi:hypothetical protein